MNAAIAIHAAAIGHGDAERDGKGEMPQVDWSNGFAIRPWRES
jgi:hypothetical protein